MTREEKKLAKILKNISVLLQIKGDIPFKARAYEVASDKISSREVNIYEAYKNKTIRNLQGFGEALEKKIIEFFDTGKITFYEKLISEIPESVAEFVKIKNIGISKAKKLYYDLNIKNLEELEGACLNNELLKIKGINETIQEQILNSTQHRIASRGRLRQEETYSLANKIIEDIKVLEGIVSVGLTSECRRFAEIIKNIEFLIIVEKDADTQNLKQKINQILSTHKEYTEVKVDINYYISDCENAGWNLHLTTGNKDYLNNFFNYASSLGFEAKSDGLYKNSERINIRIEEELFSLLGLQFIPAELRESSKAIEKAKNHQIPTLIMPEDIVGLVHVHSNWSDGKNTIEEMALKAKQLGFSYIAICDHSRSAGYTGGLSIERIKEQHSEIDRLNDLLEGIKILKGIESDILPDGSLDYPDEVLESFDLVVASIHSKFSMNKYEMTQRIIKAIQNPHTHIIGHPTGRLLLTRPSYDIDIIEIIKACADYHKIIEINANPYRLDLPWEYVMIAKDNGVRFSINPDSHNINTFTDVRFGVYVARKGWLEKKDVINTFSVDDFLRSLS